MADIPYKVYPARLEERRSGLDRRQTVKVLPTFEPFVLDGKTYYDWRDTDNIDEEEFAAVGDALVGIITQAPAVMRCDTFANRKRGEIGDADLFDLSREELTGDAYPISLVTFDDTGNFYGGISIYAITILEQGDQGFRVACRSFTMYPSVEFAEIALDIWESLSDDTFALKNGQTFDALKVTAVLPPVFTKITPVVERGLKSLELLDIRRADQGDRFRHRYTKGQYAADETWDEISIESKRKPAPIPLVESRLEERRSGDDRREEEV